MKFTALVPLSLLVLAACTNVQSGEAAKADPDAVLAEIHKVENDQIAAMTSGDLAGSTAPYAADATLLVPGSGPRGGEMITRSFESLLADKAMDMKPDEQSALSWVSDSGDLAATSFTAQYTRTGPDGKVATVPMMNQTVWKKQDDGSWKIVSDFNAEYPAEAGAAAAGASAMPETPRFAG